MKPWRVWMVGILASLIVLGHAWDICFQREHWPFSFYSMYGRLQPVRKLNLYSLRAVMPEGNRLALKELTNPPYIPQINETRLRNILMKAWNGETDPTIAHANVIAIMRGFLKTYESRRRAHLHDGPPIRELHFCRITWKLNEDGHAFRPSVETLIVMRPDGTIVEPKTSQPAHEDQDDN